MSELPDNPIPQKPKKKYNYKKKAGRPPKTLINANIPSNWKKIILDGAMEGKSNEEIRRDIMVSRGRDCENITRLWYALRDREIEFREAITIANELSKAWWIEKSRTTLDNRWFQSHSWLMQMKNRFGWRDKVEVELDASEQLLQKYEHMKADELIAKSREIAQGLLEAPKQ